ncbi:MAG: FHA domain-containing serine/threonine-protein kinase [Coriobacteriia bacterium]|nr:FHA domain-containing serine/threonine-protein kinase [Coriobacteriia bacterium]
MISIGRYEIRGELGRGAMAVVWDAWDTVLLRSVAIKELLHQPDAKEWLAEEMSSRFVQEGRLAARLVHPNIITIHEADEIDGRSIIVMEKLEGTVLSQLIDHHKLSAKRIWDILSQLLDAIIYAHSFGVIHRDIKPDNIYVTNQGLVKLTDFGIASLSQVQNSSDNLYITGSPGYMAPEQAEGKPTDVRTDLFSFSVLAYEMLLLQNPLGATSGSSREEILLRTSAAGDLKPFKEIPLISAVILKGMSKDPKDRYQDGEKYRKALGSAFEREQYRFLAQTKGKPFVLEGAAPAHFDAIPVKVPKPKDDKGRLLLMGTGALFLVMIFGLLANSVPVSLIAIVALVGILGYWMYNSTKTDKGGQDPLVGQAVNSRGAPPSSANHTPLEGSPLSNSYASPGASLPEASGDAHTINVSVNSIESGAHHCTLSTPIIIGRNRQIGSLTLDDPVVSRDHLIIEHCKGRLVARDLGSFNGTRINEQPLTGERMLQPGDRLGLGSSSIEIL